MLRRRLAGPSKLTNLLLEGSLREKVAIALVKLAMNSMLRGLENDSLCLYACHKDGERERERGMSTTYVVVVVFLID